MNLSYFQSLSHADRIDAIADLCHQHACTDKIRKIHYNQFVYQDWHPHPPKTFTDWFILHHDFSQGIKVKTAWNTQHYRDEFTNRFSNPPSTP